MIFLLPTEIFDQAVMLQDTRSYNTIVILGNNQPFGVITEVA